jgi:hypothetical protein
MVWALETALLLVWCIRENQDHPKSTYIPLRPHMHIHCHPMSRRMTTCSVNFQYSIQAQLPQWESKLAMQCLQVMVSPVMECQMVEMSPLEVV